MPFITTDDARWLQMLQAEHADIYHQPAYVTLDAHQTGGRPLAWYHETDSGRCLIPLIERTIKTNDFSRGGGYFDLSSPYGYPGLLFDACNGTSVDPNRWILQRQIPHNCGHFFVSLMPMRQGRDMLALLYD